MPINVYLIRHGQTLFNTLKRIQGVCDSPLTSKGLADAKKTGELLREVKFDYAYSSDTMRAYKTCCEILAQNQVSHLSTPKMKVEFREQNYGSFEGQEIAKTWATVGKNVGLTTFEQLVENYSFDEIKDMMYQADPLKVGEDSQKYWQRVQSGLNYLQQQHQDGANILVVGHSNTIASIVQRYAPQYQPLQNYPKNGSVTKLVLSATGLEVVYYNQTAQGFAY